MIEKVDISELKKNLENCIGQKVLLRGSLGRKTNTFEWKGTLTEIYPNLCVIKRDDINKNETCTYTDLMLRTIELDVDNNGSFDSILNITHN